MSNKNLPLVVKYDINLLVSLYFLLKECSVSFAANKLFIGQPAMSHHLAKLRVVFNDKLLIRTSTKMVMTPFAESILSALEKLLIDIEGVMEVKANLKTHTKKTYKICVTDDIYIKKIVMVLYKYTKDLGLDGVVFDVTGRYYGCVKDLNDGVIDLFFGNIDKPCKNILSQQFYKEFWYCAVSAKHPLAGKHIIPSEINGGMYVELTSLEKARHLIHYYLGESMKCALKTSSFDAAINFIQHSEALCILPSHLINQYNLSTVTFYNKHNLEVASHAYWHSAVDGDSFHQGFRNMLLNKYTELSIEY